MIAVRATGRIALATLLAATLGLAATTPALAAERAVPVGGEVDPGTLVAGPAPRMPWLDDSAQRIVRPGAGAIPTKRFGSPTAFLHARNGYLLPITLRDGRHRRVYFVEADSGRAHLVARRTALHPRVVSTDGRRLVLDDNPTGPRSVRKTVQVVRIGDGRTIGTRTFPRGSQVMAAGADRVLLQRLTPGDPGVGSYRSDTVSWDPVADTVRVVDRRTPTAGPRTELAPPASLASRRAAVRDGGHDVILDLDTRRELWPTRDGEFALSFSPDDARVVTASGLRGFNQEAPWELARKLRVRDARTGRVLAGFAGNFAIAGPGTAPVWETPRTLLLHATSDWAADPDGAGHYPNPSVIRCSTLSGSCGWVPVRWRSALLLLRKSN